MIRRRQKRTPRYDAATFELAKRLRAKAAAQLRAAGFHVPDRVERDRKEPRR